MSDIAIRVENLSKQYKLGATIGHDRIKDLLAHGLNGLFRRSRSPVARPPSADASNPQSEIPNSKSDFIWALKDISFEVKKGETLGIIGANGAGKSTLLKVLSRITEPTAGRAEIYGRVGSLLEVGTGFDRELTGRENIYLNGAVLGMRKREIARKFDEIVEFSGVEKFIETPVKRYSSGMYVRLAFAVAAHLEPEILIVDEVLAVGDASFQKRCLGKMGEVAQGGRTILFVSHNMSAITRLCSETILLQQGKMVMRDRSTEVVDQYMQVGTEQRAQKVWEADQVPNRPGPFRPIAVRVCNGSGDVAELVSSKQPFSIEIEYQVTEPVRDLRVGVKLYSLHGELLFMSFDTDDFGRHEKYHTRRPGYYVSRCHIPANMLNTGSFTIGVSASVSKLYHFLNEQSAVRFTVDITGGVATQWQDDRGGFFRPALHWDIERL